MVNRILVIDEIEDMTDHSRNMYYAWYSVSMASLISLVILWFQVNFLCSLIATLIVLLFLLVIYDQYLTAMIPFILNVRYGYIDFKYNSEGKTKSKNISIPLVYRPVITIILPYKLSIEHSTEFIDKIRHGLNNALDQCRILSISRESIVNFFSLFGDSSEGESLNTAISNGLEPVFIGKEGIYMKFVIPIQKFPCIGDYYNFYLNISIFVISPSDINYTYMFVYVYTNEETFREIKKRCLWPALFPIFYGRVDSFLRELKQHIKIIRDTITYELKTNNQSFAK